MTLFTQMEAQNNTENSPPLPEFSDVQMRIFKDRYAQPGEKSPRQMWDRVAFTVAFAEKSGTLQKVWGDRFFSLLEDFHYVPGGRILSAMGSPGGVTAQNCFVLPSPEDSREGIMKSLMDWVEIQAKGGGVGINISSLRPRDSIVKGVNGTSSGPVTWAELFAFVTHSVIQQGGSRRGAAMIMIDDNHPDVMEFVHAKEVAGRLEGCNMSVCLSNEFMAALEKDEEWPLIWNGQVQKTIQAVDLWEAIVAAAWASAEPGIYFMGRANAEANSSYFEKFNVTNPCGEQPLGPYGACLLGSMNLQAFMKGSEFDWGRFRAMVRYAVRFNDNVIDLSEYPMPECQDSQQRIRRMGIGVMGLADALIAQKLRYGSIEAIAFTEAIYRTLKEDAYLASAELASERGSFPEYKQEAYLAAPFVQRLPWQIRKVIETHGMRNCYLLTQAPTGTTSMLAGVNSGIEPYFDFKFARNDRMGVHDIVTSYSEQYDSKDRPDYLVIANDVSVQEHIAMQAMCQKHNDSSISKTVNAPSTHTLADVDATYRLAWESGLKSISYYRDGSRDVQVLNHASKEVVAPMFGSNSTKSEPTIAQRKHRATRIKLPDTRPALIHKFSVGGVDAYLQVGLYDDGAPGELFCTISKEGSTVAGLVDSLVTLASMLLQCGMSVDDIATKLIGQKFEPSGFTGNPMIPTATSIVDYLGRWLRLEFGGMVHAYASQEGTNKYSADATTSTTAVVVISSEEMRGDCCPECGAPLVHIEGCAKCLTCGEYSAC